MAWDNTRNLRVTALKIVYCGLPTRDTPLLSSNSRHSRWACCAQKNPCWNACLLADSNRQILSIELETCCWALCVCFDRQPGKQVIHEVQEKHSPDFDHRGLRGCHCTAWWESGNEPKAFQHVWKSSEIRAQRLFLKTRSLKYPSSSRQLASSIAKTGWERWKCSQGITQGPGCRARRRGGKDAHLRTQMVTVTVGAGSALGGLCSAFRGRRRHSLQERESGVCREPSLHRAMAYQMCPIIRTVGTQKSALPG